MATDVDLAAALVVQAILDAGPRPDVHQVIAERHRQEWPTLWRALDRLIGAVYLETIRVTEGHRGEEAQAGPVGPSTEARQAATGPDHLAGSDLPPSDREQEDRVT